MSNPAQLTVNTLRILSVEMIEAANSGHPGLPLGAAPMAYALWQGFLKASPTAPNWPDRDRFVLSPGHGSALMYSLLHVYGYDLPMEEIKSFRQWGSLTPGHPEFHLTPGVEATTGPLGQGMCNAIGMAVAERALANRFNTSSHTLIDHHTYAIVSDGDLMEGVTAEASSYAGHLGLGKLICLYDANDITLDGPTDLTFSKEDVGARYRAYGWQVSIVKDGDTDIDGLMAAIEEAKADTERPSLIIVKTTIGYGAPNKQGTAGVHGSPLGKSELALTRKGFGWDYPAFTVPEEAKSHAQAMATRGDSAYAAWKGTFEAWSAGNPELRDEWQAWMAGRPLGEWSNMPSFEVGESIATRSAAGKVQNAIAAQLTCLIGGDADLSCSTKTALKDGGSFEGQGGAGRNLHFGVREHGMAAIANGMAYHGGLRPFASTFLVFSDYMRPSIRLAAMNGLPVVYIFTHDSVALGEDGPTHQPIEHVMTLRAIPGLRVLRPCDALETKEAWISAANHTDGPTALVLTRQNVPTLDRQRLAPATELRRGGYILSESVGTPKVILIATGSEVHAALDAQARLKELKIPCRVVSMPCWELFDLQVDEYQSKVLGEEFRGVLRVSIEAGITQGWHRYVGRRGLTIGINRYGASAPGSTNMAKFGLTGEAVVRAIKRRLV